MPDLHPTAGTQSTLPTKPPVSTSAIYRRQPAIFKQVGYTRSYQAVGDAFVHIPRPNYYSLATWDNARKKESILIQGIEYIITTILSRMGNYTHPNPQIEDFVQANVGLSLQRWAREALINMLWAGFSVQEINYTSKLGPKNTPQTWVDDLVSYHPIQVYLVPNDFGVIKDGDPVTAVQYRSGVWVSLPPVRAFRPIPSRLDRMGALVRLPKSKRVYATYKGEGNNIYGTSIIEPCIKWHQYKEAFTDILFLALDRYATPFIWVKVPPLDTKESITDPDGTVRPKTLHELTQEQLQYLSSETALVFTQISKEQPVEIGALSTGNNFSDSFTNAIEICDDNMRSCLGIPNLIMKDKVGSLSSGGSSERQIELFNFLISGISSYIIEPLLNQLILQLIQYNFDPRLIPDALHPGFIHLKPARYTDLRVLLNGIKDLAPLFQLASYETEREYVKELLGFPKHGRGDKRTGILLSPKGSSSSSGGDDSSDD